MWKIAFSTSEFVMKHLKITRYFQQQLTTIRSKIKIKH